MCGGRKESRKDSANHSQWAWKIPPEPAPVFRAGEGCVIDIGESRAAHTPGLYGSDVSRNNRLQPHSMKMTCSRMVWTCNDQSTEDVFWETAYVRKEEWL